MEPTTTSYTDTMEGQPTTSSYQNSTSDVTTGEKDAGGKKAFPWGKLIVGLTLLAIIIFVIVDSVTTKHIATGFEKFLVWIENNIVAGVFAFMLVYFVATVCFVPGSILTLGSGFVFGKAVGLGPGVALASLAVFIGASLGATASFLVGRYLLREWVGRRLVAKYPIIKALDEALLNQGLKIFILLRLSPIIPFNAINYIGGVTSIKLRHYVVALIFILPGTVLYCFIGATAGSLSESESSVDGPLAIGLAGAGIALGLIAILALSYYAKKEFNKIVAKQEQNNTQEEDGLSPGSTEEEIQSLEQIDDTV